jgi:hypothetical protein
MIRSMNLKRIVLIALFCLLGTLFVLIPSHPANMPVPARDSGVFMYMGWRMNAGAVPYLDVWDHKPPVIFFINAIGYALTGSQLGIWLIEFLLFWIAAILAFDLLLRAFGLIPAVGGALLYWISLLALLNGGNFTESYGLAFLFAALWTIYPVSDLDFPTPRGFALGLLAGLLFFLKQNTVGLFIALAIALLITGLRDKQGRPFFQFLLAASAGFGLIAATLISYLVDLGAFEQFVDAAFLFNFSYIQKFDGGASLPSVVSGVLGALSQTGILIGALGGWIVLLLALIRKRIAPALSSFALIALIDLPIEIFLTGISGRAYPHYGITLLPVMAVLSGYLILSAQKWLARYTVSPAISAAVIAVLLVVPLANAALNYPAYTLKPAQKFTDTVNYIETNTTPADTVLVWGAETTINFLSRRAAPTRFVYQFPVLLGRDAMTEAWIIEFLGDLQAHPPVYIVDTDAAGVFYERKLGKSNSATQKGLKFLSQHYQAEITFDDWVIYRYIP